MIAFLGFTCVTMLRYVSRGGKITTDKLYSAVNVYLMIGLTWSCFYHVAELLQPGSFRIDGSISTYSQGMWSDLVYYSYVTLTTLGYGDITPLQPLSRVLSMLEAVCGVLFVAFFVARLVGSYSLGGSDEPGDA